MKITIKENKGQVAVKSDQPIDILSFLQLTCTAQLSALRTFVADHPEAKDDLYDKYNMIVSNVLGMFAPETELRPDLTAQAILEAENKIIEEKYKEMKK